MLNDMFDFSKKRTPKEAVFFYIYHTGVVLAIIGILKLLGV